MNIVTIRPLRATFVVLMLASVPASSVAAQQPAAPVAGAAPAAPAPAAQPAVLVADPAALDPGDFVWHPERATAGPVEVVVSIPQQIAYVYRGGTLIGVSTVSTGRPGHATPLGSFAIMEKHREHHSNRYNNASMPFMQRLTMDGIALHAGQIPGHPASHGCVRLPLAFARDLFAVTQVGASVRIIDAAPPAAAAPTLAQARPPVDAGRIVLASFTG